jgi:hypothetical protein
MEVGELDALRCSAGVNGDGKNYGEPVVFVGTTDGTANL